MTTEERIAKLEEIIMRLSAWSGYTSEVPEIEALRRELWPA